MNSSMRRWGWGMCLLGLVALTACAHTPEGAPAPGAERTALDEYVAKPDPTYTFKLANTIPGEGFTAYVIDMTSQTWRTPQEVDRTVWQHWVVVIKPEKVASDTGLLFISGGGNGRPAPTSLDDEDRMLVEFAKATNTVVTALYQVPNQPLVFADDPDNPRVEDDLIAYTWDKFLKTGDETWPARLPMTKAAVRAMDTITAFMASGEGGNVPVSKFVVAGGSKRGWTTWTTAAVDKRVVAIAPFVIDMLNLQESFKHHYRAYGFWAPAVGDYTEMGLMDWLGKPQYRDLMKIVEPYEYRSRFTMPKYIVNSTGDQFFLPDSSQYYFDDLPGEKYLRYVPNTDHGLGGSDAPQSFAAWYASIVYDKPRPKFSWTLEDDGSIRVQVVDKPLEVKLWQATNPKDRDFRLVTIGKNWTATTLTDSGNGVYVGQVPKPETGWTAFMVELTYDSGIPQAPYKFTTPVRVVPDVLPYADKI
jgi:PhoPQ-activated pathogenicity-related protein